MKRIILSLAALLTTWMVWADHVKFRVIDAETQEPLAGAVIDAEFSGDLYGDIQFCTDSLGYFVSPDWFGYLGTTKMDMKINYFGYHQTRKVTTFYEGNDTIDLGTVALKPSEELLREVEVSGRMRRFTMSGDTVVFHPEAFHLEEGARLEELIERLPGVSVTDMGLMWNGKPLMLKLNGHDAIADGDMLGRLPAGIVQSIKTYEKQSEMAARTGQQDERGQQVLDIIVKPGFMDKFYGDVSAQGTTGKHYLGEADMQRLSDFDPIILYLRVGDNDEFRPDRGWGRGGFGRGSEYRQQMGVVGYQHAWESPYKDATEHNRWNIDLTPNHYDHMSNSWSNQQVFMPDGQSTYTQQTGSNYQHTWKIPLTTSWRRELPGNKLLTGHVSADFGQNRNESHSEQSTYDADPSEAGHAINTSQSQQQSQRKQAHIQLQQRIDRYFQSGNLTLRFEGKAEKDQQDQSSTADYTYSSASLAPVHDVQTGDHNHHRVEALLEMSVSKKWTPSIQTQLMYVPSYHNDYLSDSRMRGDGVSMALDQGNSLRQRQQQMEHLLTLSGEQKLSKKVSMTQNVILQNAVQWLDYHRGTVLDTTVRRTILNPNIQLRLRWRVAKASEFTAGASWNRTAPNLVSTLAFVDDTNPLHIVMGNPHLHATSQMGLNVGYNLTRIRGEQNLAVSTSVTRSVDPVMSLLRYDSQTGVYRSTQENGRGGYSIDLSPNYDRALGERFRLRVDGRLMSAVSYGNLTRVDGDETPRELRQQQLYASLNPNVSYDSRKWNAELYLRSSYNGSYYNQSDYQSTRLWDYDPGCKVRFKLKHWDFSLAAHLRGGHGYIADELNRNKFLMDGEVTWKCIKNKGQLTLLANDIFNQNTMVTSSVTAQQRRESGRSFIHHYVGLRFQYHLDAKEK